MTINPDFDELKKAGLTIHEVVNAIFAATQQLVKVAAPVSNVILQLGYHRNEFENDLPQYSSRSSAIAAPGLAEAGIRRAPAPTGNR
jgi:hypothetical protein